jgi:hypothetical protein
MNMEMQRKTMSRSGNMRASADRSFLTVGVPQPYEGIGNALRSTFRAGRDSLPSDMLDLLDKLDRH